MKASVPILLFALFVGVTPFHNKAEAGEKVVLIEIFTNTGCVSCVSANTYFQNWLANYRKKDRVAVVKYHVWWPQDTDPFYQATSHLVRTRHHYYGDFYGVPQAVIDGFLDGWYFYNMWPDLIESRMDVTPPFTLSLSGNTSDESSDIEVTVASTGDEIPSGTLRVFIAIVESDIEYTGTNGAPVHYYVLRNMLTGANGKTFTIGLNAEKSFEMSFNWDSNWEFDKSKIVMFVQVAESKEVLQARMIPINEVGNPTSVIAGTGDIPSSLQLYQNYPNPFNPSTVIRYAISEHTHTRLSIYNTMGQEMVTLVKEVREAGYHEITFNASHLPSGVYIYRLQAGEYVQSRKMLYLK
jgi:hypothetical protein